MPFLFSLTFSLFNTSLFYVLLHLPPICKIIDKITNHVSMRKGLRKFTSYCIKFITVFF